MLKISFCFCKDCTHQQQNPEDFCKCLRRQNKAQVEARSSIKTEYMWTLVRDLQASGVSMRRDGQGEKAEMLVVAQFPEVQVDHAQTWKSGLRTGMS